MAKRLIKWVGDPPVLKSDGWSVANWRYENARSIALPGGCERIITKFDHVPIGNGRFKDIPNGLSRDYYWHRNTPGFVLEVEEEDARIILARQPHEFRDVTDVADPSTVRNEPIILKDDQPQTNVKGLQSRIITGRNDFLNEYQQRPRR